MEFQMRIKEEENIFSSTRFKEDKIKEIFSKYFKFLSNLKIPFAHSFKLLNCNNNNVVFYNQFYDVLRKIGCKLLGNEIITVYNHIDTAKKLYFNQFDYEESIKKMYFNINKKNLEVNEENFNLKEKHKSDVENIYLVDDFDKKKIIYYILTRLNEYMSKFNIGKDEIYNFIANRNTTKTDYFQLNKLISFLKIDSYSSISNYEIELFKLYIDSEDIKLVFKEEFNNKIINIINTFIIDAINLHDTSVKEYKNTVVTINRKVSYTIKLDSIPCDRAKISSSILYEKFLPDFENDSRETKSYRTKLSRNIQTVGFSEKGFCYIFDSYRYSAN